MKKIEGWYGKYQEQMQILGQNDRPYIRVHKDLISCYQPDKAVFISNLIDKAEFFTPYDGWFYHTHEQQMQEIRMIEYSIKQCKKFFIAKGILEIRRQGLPAKEYYRIHMDKLLKDINDLSNKEEKENSSSILGQVREKTSVLCDTVREKTSVQENEKTHGQSIVNDNLFLSNKNKYLLSSKEDKNACASQAMGEPSVFLGLQQEKVKKKKLLVRRKPFPAVSNNNGGGGNNGATKPAKCVAPKKDPPNEWIKPLVGYFSDQCLHLHSYKPKTDGGDIAALKRILNERTEVEVRDLMDFFLHSEKCKLTGALIRIALSTHTQNLWLAERNKGMAKWLEQQRAKGEFVGVVSSNREKVEVADKEGNFLGFAYKDEKGDLYATPY